MSPRGRNYRDTNELLTAMADKRTEPSGPIETPKGYMVPRRWDVQPHDHRADSPEVQRERRRKRLAVILDERLSLSAELVDALGDLPGRISADRNPARWTARVGEAFAPIAEALTQIARAVHAPALALPFIADGSGARRVVLDPETVVDGSWAMTLAAAALTLDDRLADALGIPGRAVNGDTLSDFVLERLREIDRAAKGLRTHVDRVQSHESPESDTPPPPPVDPWELLRRKHAAEIDALNQRHTAELQAVSAAQNAERLARQARA